MRRNKPKARSLTFESIKIGDKHNFKRIISQKDVDLFAALTGDFNPLHTDDKFAKTTRFKGRIAHGMLAASLFSTLIGMYCPGRHALIIDQEIKYLKPVRPGARLKVIGEVVNKISAVGVIIIKTSIIGESGEPLTEGISKVKVMR